MVLSRRLSALAIRRYRRVTQGAGVSNPVERRIRNVLTILGVVTVVYSVFVLGYVATSPDLGIRVLMIDDAARAGDGVIIQSVGPIEYRGDLPIEPGDTLVGIARTPTHNFLDFTVQIHELYNAPIPPGGQLDHWIDPSAVETSLPPLVQVEEGGRMVEIQFRKAGSLNTTTGWITLQSLPLEEAGLTFFWLILQLAIFAVAAFAYWKRPFDPSARVFFAMCLVSTGAFVGGYHWWVIAGSMWLNTPFVICAILLPSVTLHFFLVYPHFKAPMIQHPVLTRWLLYGIPAAAIVFTVGILGIAHLFRGTEEFESRMTDLLTGLRQSIYIYISVSSIYFVATLVALINSFFTTRTPIERHQVRWILWAGLAATVPLGYTLYLANADQVGFTLGRGRIPMFLASLSFMLAYAIGILRYKLILADEVVHKGVLYYFVSFTCTMACGVALAFGTIGPQMLSITLSTAQQVALFLVLILAAVLVFWLRDRMQRLIDRQFFREKYQLDKALQRMNRAAEHLLDSEAMASLMLGTCRDVLGIQTSAVYLQVPGKELMQLTAVEGTQRFPFQVRVDQATLEQLKHEPSLQRVPSGSRESMPPVQKLLHDLQTDVIHSLESEEGISGFVVLGAKQSSGGFSAEDVTFLNAMVQITNVALHSTKVHQDLTRLNDELQLKVDRIGEQKRQIELLQLELESLRTAEPEPAPPVPASDTEAADFIRDSFKGDSPTIRRVLRTVQKVAATESTVLIRGESGTGKELIAQLLHENSSRQAGPLVSVHCASLSPGLLESELFGHAKGAFTGAHKDRIGRFEAASGGTLFLDEIGDISLETQIKLLRVLQERTFEPVGSSRTVNVDVRLVTATHQNLEKLIEEGRFREDLFYRLNVISIPLPPLRERRQDLLELARFFLERASLRAGKRVTQIEEPALHAIQSYQWPGNVRELENVIERAVVLAEDEHISMLELPGSIREAFELAPLPSPEPEPLVEEEPFEALAVSVPLQDGRNQERESLLRALKEADGNKAQAARILGLPRSTYYSRLKKYGIG